MLRGCELASLWRTFLPYHCSSISKVLYGRTVDMHVNLYFDHPNQILLTAISKGLSLVTVPIDNVNYMLQLQSNLFLSYEYHLYFLT